MGFSIPWLTEGIKKRGVRYLLHHYLGQFFEEKLTLEQLSIDIYEGKGSIRDLNLDVNGLNDELDFIPFKFLEGCVIGQISVEVPWVSLATEACRVELEGAKFVCRLKTLADGSKVHCTESTLLSRSLMTSSMQMAEEIVTTEDDEDYESPSSSIYRHNHHQQQQGDPTSSSKKKDANQMFEGLEMFAQLIDSVLRRTKLTARNTLFQIQPHSSVVDDDDSQSSNKTTTSTDCNSGATSGDEFREATARSDTASDDQENQEGSTRGTVEFFISFFRCEEILVESTDSSKNTDDDEQFKRPFNVVPETVTKLLTLEDVEMRIGGVPVSNLIGKHTIMIKFNGQKSEISIFSGSPLLAVIGHQQLKTFFNVFDSAKENDFNSSPSLEKDQKVMSPDDYAKIENQLLEAASLRNGLHQVNDLGGFVGSNQTASHSGGGGGNVGGRRWIENGELFSNMTSCQGFDYNLPNSSTANCLEGKVGSEVSEPTLDNLEAFSCELKLPGIWLCILRDGETLPPLIKPYADSINSFHTINKYIDQHIKVPHIRLLALKVALDITTSGINVHLGDLNISEHLSKDSMNPTLNLLHNDLVDLPINTSRYKASIVNNKEITIDLLSKTRIVFDPTMIDRIVFDYKLVKLKQQHKANRNHPANIQQKLNNQLDLNLTIRGEQFKVELLCPIPDLTPEAQNKTTLLRPQSFLFDLKNINLGWQDDQLNISAIELEAFVKTQPKQSDEEAVRFIEASGRNNDKIVLTLEPSPANLDTAFPNEIEQTLNESSMYDSIYVGQAYESKLPTEAFQTKRKVVRANLHQSTSNGSSSKDSGHISECDNEKIITPGDRQHLIDYLHQTIMSTKLSISIHLPSCEVEFEDKEQLDLIYNRFANDFVFWQPEAFKVDRVDMKNGKKKTRRNSSGTNDEAFPRFEHPINDSDSNSDNDSSERESEVSFHSMSLEGSGSDYYENEVTCKIQIDELFVKFNHQSCAAALKQEISVENLLLGVVIDINKKPGTVLSLVSDNLELSTDSNIVLHGNTFGDKNSILSLTAEIKRPTEYLKDIKLAIQLVNGLFRDFKTETYNRFWQSINVTDEPILGFVAPKIVTELHVDVLNTALLLVRDGARPALLTIDELYLTSMVMEQTSQVMIRLIADEVSLYLKRNKQGFEVIKNYICLIDSGLIDLDIKLAQDGRLEFGVINNVINVRACQDSLSALYRLMNVLFKSAGQAATTKEPPPPPSSGSSNRNPVQDEDEGDVEVEGSGVEEPVANETSGQFRETIEREKNLLMDAMNNFSDSSASSQEGILEDNSSLSSSSSSADSDDCDSDSPPVIQRANGRDPNACILDESNPKLGDYFSQPLLPAREKLYHDSEDDDEDDDDGGNEKGSDDGESFESTSKSIDESGFFVIGNDDVGAGIIDKLQHEPVVRKLIEGPINIIENHFKMTKPRTIPEILAGSLERYVLEEMTLVVSLFGGRDFDDERSDDETASTTTTADDEEATMVGAASSSMENLSMRSRAGSLAAASTRTMTATTTPKQTKPATDSSSLKRKAGGRRKHLSEGSGAGSNLKSSLADPAGAAAASASRAVRFGEGAVNLWESLDLMTAPDFLGTKKRPQAPPSADSKMAGGTWRQTDVCIQLTLSKVKLLYELGAPEESPIAWRFMLFIHDIEVKDRIQASDINKMLYEYCTESMPKRDTQMLTIRNIATINPTDGCEECDLRVSIKPLRLNVDQDTLVFLIDFFTSLTKSLAKQQQSLYAATSTSTPPSANASEQQPQRPKQAAPSDLSSGAKRRAAGSSSSSSAAAAAAAAAQSARMQQGEQKREQIRAPARSLSASGGAGSSVTTTTTTTCAGERLPTHCHADGPSQASHHQQHHSVYIKSFTFSPDVPVRFDYHAKHLDFEQGALAGILMGLAHLDHSEVVLRRVQAKHGMRGIDKALLFALSQWTRDIKRSQLPSILSGVGPMHSVLQLFQGVRDLIWMPIDHYRRDRRLVRGLQRGASSFSSSTAMAAINLMNRFISIVQCTAQIAHDIVTPPSLQLSMPAAAAANQRHHQQRARRHQRRARSHIRNPHLHQQSKLHHPLNGLDDDDDLAPMGPMGNCCNPGGGLNQPRNFCEGVAVGFNILRDGFEDTARSVAVGMQAEDVRSAMGELVRQIPSTLLNPIISATEGAQNVLVGIRNQIAPDARREDQEKWKRRVRGK